MAITLYMSVSGPILERFSRVLTPSLVCIRCPLPVLRVLPDRIHTRSPHERRCVTLQCDFLPRILAETLFLHS
jgi:hypothetical protein